MRAMLFSVPFFTMCACFATFARNDGEAIIPTIATIVGGVINMFLDVFLVFGLDLGILGAGYATAIGQTVAFLILASYFVRKKCALRLVRPKKIGKKLTRIVTLGASAFILELAFAATITVYNKLIDAKFDHAHLAVFSTASTVTIMFICLFNAIGTALQPISATAFGGGRRDRVDKARALSLKIALLLGVCFFALAELFPGTILKIYMDVTDEVMAIGPRLLRIYCLGIIFTGISIVSTYYFQSVLNRDFSMYISLSRGLVFPIALAVLLPFVFGDGAIWWATAISELITLILSLIFIYIEKKNNKIQISN
jgi:Na+-driven multidrug efflux pump